MARVISIGRRWLFPEYQTVMFLVRCFILEEPDVEDYIRVFREEVLLEFVDCPFDGTFGAFLYLLPRFITNDDERRLNNNRELIGRQSLL